MLKFTLMRNLFKELNPSRMEGVQQRRVRDNFSRTMAVAYEDVPEVWAYTIQERAVSYGVLYYLFLNDDRAQADLEEVRVKKLLLAFYGDHFPKRPAGNPRPEKQQSVSDSNRLIQQVIRRKLHGNRQSFLRKTSQPKNLLVIIWLQR